MKMRCIKIRAVLTPIFFLLISTQASAQTREFNPEFNSVVYKVVIEDSGSFLVSGGFQIVNGIPHSRIARIRSDGVLMQGFDPQPNKAVTAIATLPNGQILIGGDFTTLGGTSGFVRNRIAKLNHDGTVDPDFDPNVNDTVRDIVVQPDGKILIAGDFTNVGGTFRGRLARLNSDGSLDMSFSPNINNRVNKIVLQPNGDILIGGSFINIDGTSRSRVARLDQNGELDMDFVADVNGSVQAIAVQNDGKILIGGEFTAIGQNIRWRLARLEAVDGSLDLDYNPVVNGDVLTLVLQDDGKVLAAGRFLSVTEDFIPRDSIARFKINGSLDNSFETEIASFRQVRDLVVQADGQIVIVGTFENVWNTPRSRMARLNPDGSLEQLIEDFCLPISVQNGAVANICL